MSKYRNIKVHVPTPEISEAVQKKLFEDGVEWWPSSVEPKYLGKRFLTVDGQGRLGFCVDGEEGFKESRKKEIPYQSILDPYYDVKIAWANGEAVQRLTRVDDWEKWVDWRSGDYLDIKSGYLWRVKPKTKIYKQWERKFWDGENVNMARSTDENPDWDVGFEWINEPELKEYEVPND